MPPAMAQNPSDVRRSGSSPSRRAALTSHHIAATKASASNTPNVCSVK